MTGTGPTVPAPNGEVLPRCTPSGLTLGVDAGGTGTRAVVVDGGAVVAHRSAGPMNVLLHADALDRLAAMVAETGVRSAGLGLAGVRGPAEARRIETELHARTGADIVVGDDAEVALLGAFDGGPGIVVIAGTGSAAIARDAAGRTVRAGGHGFLLGDEGAGYWIGREAVRAALRSAEGTGERSEALEAVVASVFGGSLGNVEQRVYAAPTDRRLLARLVPVIDSLSDPVVAKIFTAAAQHLAELAEGVRRRVGDLPVAMVGGIWNVVALRRAFVEATGASDPLQPPEYGAVLLAALPGRDAAQRGRGMGWAS